MKKITYALIAFLIFGNASFAQQQKGLKNLEIHRAKNTEMRTISPSQTGYGQASTSKALIWSNDFSNPADWLMTNTAGTGNWQINTVGPIGDFSGGPLTSTTAANGFAFFDSDNDCTGNQVASIQNVTAINCSGHPNVSLSFQEYYKRFYDSTFVYVSNNGTTWTKFPVHATFANNKNTANGQTTKINISSVAGNQATVYVKFTFYSPSSMGTNAGCGYWWLIDDLLIESIENNDIAARSSYVDMNGWDYFMVVPVKQLDTIYCGGALENIGLLAQTNVAMNINVNAGTYTATSAAIPSLAPFAKDTLWTRFIPIETVSTEYKIAYSYTQTEVDANPLNNIGDTMTIYSELSEYWRTLNVNSLVNSYSFGTSAPAASGMEYGATYHFKTADRIDSITVPIYRSHGTPSIQGKLYKVNITTNAKTLVASTAVVPVSAMAYSGTPNIKTLAFTTPYTVAANEFLAATFAITGTMGSDTLSIGSDGDFAGDNSIAGVAYLKVNSTWGWYSYDGVPVVGLKTKVASTANDILSFNLTTPAATGLVDATAHTVALTVPSGTDVTALVPTFTLSTGATAKVGAVAQVSGTTANNFTAPVTYNVTAEDGTTTQAWVVTVTVTTDPASTETDILTFDLTSPAVTGIVDATAHTVALTVPSGTNVTALVPTFTLSTGATAKVGAVAQVSGTTANNFTAPVTYNVTAEDGTTTQAWVVTVTVTTDPASTETDILTFDLTSPAVTGIVDATAHTVALTVPSGTDVTALVPTFTLSTGATAKVCAVAQVSGTTANDFTAPVTYNVTAEDGTTTQAWVVTVSITAET
ncbi:MAG: hypothetical protein PHR79_08365, partial [Bacteroidales bacterium]|nr:hypothetical protein [Bacteroidales bacterium]